MLTIGNDNTIPAPYIVPPMRNEKQGEPGYNRLKPALILTTGALATGFFLYHSVKTSHSLENLVKILFSAKTLIVTTSMIGTIGLSVLLFYKSKKEDPLNKETPPKIEKKPIITAVAIDSVMDQLLDRSKLGKKMDALFDNLFEETTQKKKLRF